MKSIVSILCAAALALTLTACSKKDGANAEPKSGNAQSATSLPNPFQLDPSKPILVQALNQAYFGWQGKTVTLVGYPDTFFEEEELKEAKTIKLTGAAGDKKPLFECALAQPLSAKLSKKKTITVKGKYNKIFGKVGTSGYYAILTDCQVIANDEPMPPAAQVTAFSMKEADKVAAASLFAGITAWEGKEISVTGYYVATTKSSSQYGSSIRIDLVGENKGLAEVSDKMMKFSCYTQSDFTADLDKARKENKPVIIKGKLEDFMGEPQLQKSILVK